MERVRIATPTLMFNDRVRNVPTIRSRYESLYWNSIIDTQHYPTIALFEIWRENE